MVSPLQKWSKESWMTSDKNESHTGTGSIHYSDIGSSGGNADSGSKDLEGRRIADSDLFKII